MVKSKRPFVLLPLLAGCYNYATVTPTAVPVGSEVRATISGAASDRVAPIIGSFNQRVLTGSVVENHGGSVVLQVQSGAIQNTGEMVVPLFQRVPLEQNDFIQLETRRLDKVRTTIVIGAVGAAVGLAAYAALQSHGGASGDPDGGDGGGNPINRIPLLRFRF